jgi:rSAM/selenodomain-associated transferase 1
MGSLRRAAIVMAKQPERGQAKTRLSPPYTQAQAAALAEALLRDTLTNLTRAGCAETVLAFAPSEAAAWFAGEFPTLARIAQPDGDLGVRMRGVLDAAWRLRYQPCVLLGADSPDLPPDLLCAAFDALRPGAAGADVVLGPAADGGYYLLGLKERQPELFREIAWGSAYVLAQTRARAEARGLRVHLLPPWYDIDTAADLDRLHANLQTAPPEVCPATRKLLKTLNHPLR